MILVIAAGLFLVCAAWIVVYRYYWDKGLSVSISFSGDMVRAGDTAKLTEVIENRKKLPVPVIEVRFSLKKGLQIQDAENASVSDHIYKRDIFAVLGMQKITREITFTCEKRGLYQIKQVEILASSLLYQEQYTKEILFGDISIPSGAKAPSGGNRETLSYMPELYVCPRQTAVQDILSVSMHMLGEQQARKYLCEDYFAFQGIREYTPQDARKTINWNATAKTGNLMVNTYDSSLRGKFMIYLDVENPSVTGREMLMEEGISIASSLAGKLLAAGMETGLAINGENGKAAVILPAAGRMQLVRIQRNLAVCEIYEGNHTFASLLESGKKLRDTVFLFITTELKNQKFMEDFLGQENFGIWIYLKRKADTHVPKGGRSNLKLCVREVWE